MVVLRGVFRNRYQKLLLDIARLESGQQVTVNYKKRASMYVVCVGVSRIESVKAVPNILPSAK